MFISVLVANYNNEEYLVECLESIIKQTISDDLFEVIILDDASSDNSKKIIKNYPFQKIFLKKNIGLSSARGYLLKRSSSKATHVFFIDSDDYINPECLKELVYTATQNLDKIAACKTIKNGKTKSTTRGGRLSIINTTQHSKLWPKENLINIKWPERLKNEDDYAITWALGGKELVINNKAIYFHRAVKGSLSTIRNKENAKRMVDLCIKNWDLSQKNLSLLHHSVSSEGASKYYKLQLKKNRIKRPRFLAKVKYIGFKRAFADFWTDMIFR